MGYDSEGTTLNVLETKAKICPVCKIEFPYTEEYFRKHSKSPNGLGSYCKICTRLQTGQYRFLNKEKIHKKATEKRAVIKQKMLLENPIDNTIRTCVKCFKTFPSTKQYFMESNDLKSGLRSSCRNCTNEASRLYTKNNPGQKSASGKKYRSSNGEVIKERHKAYNKTLNGRINRYKKSARDRDLPYMLTREQFEVITKLECHYCGVMDGSYSGIDRKDSKLGYVIENCLPCCSKCNRAKVDNSYEDFIAMCTAVAQRHNNLMPNVEVPPCDNAQLMLFPISSNYLIHNAYLH